MEKEKVLKSGTVLPLLNLKGKEYLQVAHRLVWFREERQNWSIETDCVVRGDNYAEFKAFIKDETGRIISTGHKREDRQGFPDYTEKAETGAVGRALALAGFGTQFAPDLDEGDRLADSPVQPAAKGLKENTEAKQEELKSKIDPSFTNFAKIYDELMAAKTMDDLAYIWSEQKPLIATLNQKQFDELVSMKDSMKEQLSKKESRGK